MLTENTHTSKQHSVKCTSMESPTSRFRMFRKVGLYVGLFLGLALSAHTVGCFDTIKTSKGFKCEKDSDCWDGIPCVNEGTEKNPSKLCGGTPPKPKPKPEPRPEPPPSEGKVENSGRDAGTPPEPPPADIKCAVPGGAITLCQSNSSCKSGTCGAFKIPGCAKESKACTCSSQADCVGTQKCCMFGSAGVCSPFPCPAP